MWEGGAPRAANGLAQEKVARELEVLLREKLVGQPQAIEAIVPYVKIYLAGLAPEGRPAGVFLLLGPTGTGKTRTVEALAEALHGSKKHLLRIDCGEFQLDHEVARLIGAPPGYLGHRETQPLLTQSRLASVTSERCDLALVLFDEVEKAAPSLMRLLLGVLDKATLRLGDNTSVNFERTMIFLTSNVGGAAMVRRLRPGYGFERNGEQGEAPRSEQLESIGVRAARKKFSPEFLNRVDRIISYQPLNEQALAEILDQHITEFQKHVEARLGPRGFSLDVPAEARRALLRKGASLEYGARELKRTLHRHLIAPLGAMLSEGRLAPGGTVRLVFDAEKDELRVEPEGSCKATV